jgi:phage regulator Rha-like protein
VQNLVSIIKSKPFTTSLIIADGVGNEHRAVMQLLKKHQNSEILSTFQTSELSTKGRPIKFAYLSELQSIFLITLMDNTPTVVKFKEALSKEFLTNRQALENMTQDRKESEWVASRTAGKLAHRNLTDKIKEFTEYAVKQGSENYDMYYLVIPKMSNRLLFNQTGDDFDTLRQFLTRDQLINIANAEKVTVKALTEGMSQELEYKEVYKLADEKVAGFAEIVGTSEIMGALPEQIGLLA